MEMKTSGAFLVILLAAAPAFGKDGAISASAVGIEERLGASVDLDLRFAGEDGAQVRLGDLVRTPVILSLVYFRCPNACDFLLIGMADVLNSLPAEPGKDYRVLTLSIDDRETAMDARAAKRIGLESIGRPFPADAWRFLTGSGEAIRALSDAVGFRFARNGDVFDHPLGLVVLSPQGKVVRYLNGTAFLPADLKMSLLEASTGTIGPTISRVLRFCFRTDPSSHRLVFNTLKVTGAVTLTIAAAFVLYLILSTRKRRMKRKASSDGRV
jgi:protein SCO1